MLESVTFWVHLMAAAVWIGPQVLLPLAALPALRTLEPSLRKRALAVLTARYGYASWAALAVLVVTGVGNTFQVRSDTFGGDFGAMFDARYGLILGIKLALVAATLLLTAWHAFVLGPRVLALVDAPPEDQARAAGLRRLSVAVSTVNLAIGVVILYLVTLLQNGEFSLRPL
ncbi:MAG TPA: CopD family protein [Dehalococcoidia bacterium]